MNFFRPNECKSVPSFFIKENFKASVFIIINLKRFHDSFTGWFAKEVKQFFFSVFRYNPCFSFQIFVEGLFEGDALENAILQMHNKPYFFSAQERFVFKIGDFSSLVLVGIDSIWFSKS